jgi:TPR repeat protein
MGTRKHIAGLLGLALLLAGPALAGPPELDAAIDAYLEKDYSEIDLIRRYADAGEADALAIIGQAYLYGMGYTRDPDVGVTYLTRAAEAGDWPAAVQLSRIYSYGDAGQAKDEAKSAEFAVLAAKLGDPAGPRRLSQMARDLVIAAGGGGYLSPAPADAAPAPAETPAPEPAAPSGESTILTRARAGSPDAARILARFCLRQNQCPSTRAEAHDLLVAAARKDPSAATTLGAIYRDGVWGGTPQMVAAAQWIGYAFEMGLESALYMLEDLPRDAVREAGKEHILIQLEARDRVAAAAAASSQSTDAAPAPGQLAASLADAIFDRAPTPDPVTLASGQRFALLADTPLSAHGDAAASCLLVIEKELDEARSELAETTLLQAAANAYRSLVSDPARNGGLDRDAVTMAVISHEFALRQRPASAPSALDCRRNYVPLLAATSRNKP